MTCADFELLICDYVDGTLDSEQNAAVEKHLAECATCAELTRDAAAAVAFMQDVPPVGPPDELVTRILYNIPSARSGVKAGWRSWMGRWLEPVLQPRFAMGMAMTILSFSLLARFVGIPERQLRPADLHPSRVVEAVDDRFERAWNRVVKYYDSLQTVYEIQNRLSKWSEENAQSTEAGSGLPEFDPRLTEREGDSQEGAPAASERSTDQ